jgi:peptidoglycan-N-acetylglucosamine deacetylase
MKKRYKKKETVIFEANPQKGFFYKKAAFTGIFFVIGIFLLPHYLTSHAFTYESSLMQTLIPSASPSSTIEPFSPEWQKLFSDNTPENVASSAANEDAASTETSDQVILHGPRDKKEVALTFDGDMTPTMLDYLHTGEVETYDDSHLTDFLTQHQIKATFFLTGMWAEVYPDATRAMASNPLFEIEDHSYSHPSFSGDCYGLAQVPSSQYSEEIEKAQRAIEQIAHVRPKYFRFPGGCYDQSVLALVKKEGLETVHWDDVADDGFNHNKDAIVSAVLDQAQNGSIIVMHMGGESNAPETANALPEIVDALQARGFAFVTVDEMLHPESKVTRIDPKKYLTGLKSFQSETAE